MQGLIIDLLAWVGVLALFTVLFYENKGIKARLKKLEAKELEVKE